jgi:hypothetical protein
MQLADLLFILLVLVAAASLALAAACAVRRQYRRAGRVLWRLLLGAGGYMLCVIAVSLTGSRRVMQLQEPQCFDDWCVTIGRVHKEPAEQNTRYTVVFRLSSRALRVPQRERNVAVYLSDSLGRRFNPMPNASYVPFDVLLQPGQAINADRSFLIPNGAQHLGVVVRHEGGFPIGWFILNYDTWFRKPPIVEIQ